MLRSQNKSPEAGELCVKPQWRNATSVKGSLVLCFFLLTFPALAFSETGTASWYSVEACRWNKTAECKTASGVSLYELERKKIMFAASWKYPLGTKVRVTNKQNSKSVVVLVADRGPAKRLARVIDLGKGAFEQISSVKKGIINVTVERL